MAQTLPVKNMQNNEHMNERRMASSLRNVTSELESHIDRKLDESSKKEMGLMQRDFKLIAGLGAVIFILLAIVTGLIITILNDTDVNKEMLVDVHGKTVGTAFAPKMESLGEYLCHEEGPQRAASHDSIQMLVDAANMSNGKPSVVVIRPSAFDFSFTGAGESDTIAIVTIKGQSGETVIITCASTTITLSGATGQASTYTFNWTSGGGRRLSPSVNSYVMRLGLVIRTSASRQTSREQARARRESRPTPTATSPATPSARASSPVRWRKISWPWATKMQWPRCQMDSTP